jgi:hypothetical protein
MLWRGYINNKSCKEVLDIYCVKDVLTKIRVTLLGEHSIDSVFPHI